MVSKKGRADSCIFSGPVHFYDAARVLDFNTDLRRCSLRVCSRQRHRERNDEPGSGSPYDIKALAFTDLPALPVPAFSVKIRIDDDETTRRGFTLDRVSRAYALFAY